MVGHIHNVKKKKGMSHGCGGSDSCVVWSAVVVCQLMCSVVMTCHGVSRS